MGGGGFFGIGKGHGSGPAPRTFTDPDAPYGIKIDDYSNGRYNSAIASLNAAKYLTPEERANAIKGFKGLFNDGSYGNSTFNGSLPQDQQNWNSANGFISSALKQGLSADEDRKTYIQEQFNSLGGANSRIQQNRVQSFLGAVSAKSAMGITPKQVMR